MDSKNFHKNFFHEHNAFFSFGFNYCNQPLLPSRSWNLNDLNKIHHAIYRKKVLNRLTDLSAKLQIKKFQQNDLFVFLNPNKNDTVFYTTSIFLIEFFSLFCCE